MGSGLLTGRLLAGLVAAVVVIGGAAAVFALGGDDSSDAGDDGAAVAATGTPAAATTTEASPTAEGTPPPSVVIDLDELLETLELADGSTIRVAGLDFGDVGLAALVAVPPELLTGCFAVSTFEAGAFDLGELPCTTINRIGEPARRLGNFTLSETAGGSSSSSGGGDHAIFVMASDGSKISALRNDEATGERIPGDYFFAGAGPTHELKFGDSYRNLDLVGLTVYPGLQRQAAERLSQDSLDIQQALQWLVFPDGTQLQAANLVREDDGALETVFLVPPQLLQQCLQLLTVPGTAFQVNGQGCLPVVGQVEEIQPDADLGPLGSIFVVPREDTVIAAIKRGGVTATADLPPVQAPRKIRYGFRLEF